MGMQLRDDVVWGAQLAPDKKDNDYEPRSLDEEAIYDGRPSLRADLGDAVDELEDGVYLFEGTVMSEEKVANFSRAGEIGYNLRPQDIACDGVYLLDIGQRCGTLEGVDQIVGAESAIISRGFSEFGGEGIPVVSELYVVGGERSPDLVDLFETEE